MRPPDDHVTVIAPERVRDLVFGFLIVEGADLRGIEILGQLRQRVVGTFQNPHIAAIGVHCDQPMQEAGFILDPSGPAVDEQHEV